MKRFVFTCLFGLMLSGLALANITVSVAPTVTPTGSVFTWSYDVTLGGAETATSTVPGGSCTGSTATACAGTFFTIYDFAGYQAGTASAPSGWGVSVQLIGLTPTGQTPDTGDVGAVPNLTFFYTGAQITGPQDLGTFSAESSFGNAVMGSYTEQSNSNPPGTREHGGGLTMVPASAVPEPASLALIGAGLIGLAIGRKRFTR